MLTSLGRVLHHPVVPLLLLVLANAVFYISIAFVIASALGAWARLPTIGPAFAEINVAQGSFGFQRVKSQWYAYR
jgi:hypothetical protein